MEVLLIVFLTLLNGVFAMSELALASSRKARLTAMAEAGDKGAAASLKLLEDPTQFLSTVQVGITSIGVLNGIVGEAAFSDDLGAWLQGLGMTEAVSAVAATAMVVTVITFVTIIFGELVPKRIGQLHPELVARWVARPMVWLASVARPFVRLLALSTHGVLRLMAIDTRGSRQVTHEEIAASLEEGVDAGLIEEHEHRMVRNVFHLDDRPLTSLMIPRSEIDWLDAGKSVAQCLQQIVQKDAQAAHSWYPVCRGGLDDVVGIIAMSRLLGLGPGHVGAIESEAMPATFVPETLSGMELLEQLRERTGRMVFVVDEYGVVQGLLTPWDLLEAITGELQPDAPVDAWATPQNDGTWIVDGLMPVSELKARLQVEAELPDEDKGRYNTVAGLLMAVTGRLPEADEKVICAGLEFSILALEGRRIDRIHVRRLNPE